MTELHTPPTLTRAPDAAAAPPLKQIALTRLAYGPDAQSSSDYDAAPGATDTAKFAAWVHGQLTPATIDDSGCDARVAAMGGESIGLLPWPVKTGRSAKLDSFETTNSEWRMSA